MSVGASASTAAAILLSAREKPDPSGKAALGSGSGAKKRTHRFKHHVWLGHHDVGHGVHRFSGDIIDVQ